MEASGFSRTITSKSGTYKLPHAEYNFIGNETRSEVLELAKTAAATVATGAKILVTESAGRTWSNLDSAE